MLTQTLTPHTDPERFVSLGVNGAGSLHWRISLGTTITEAARLLQICGAYNQFDPANVIPTLAAYWDHVGEFELAREHSIAIYATLPYWKHQTLTARADPPETPHWLTGHTERIDETETRRVALALMGDLHADHADEVSCTDDQGISTPIHNVRPRGFPDRFGRPYRVRAWWD